MKLCRCGCGKEVLKETNNYINGHNSGTKENNEKIKQTSLKHFNTDHPSKSIIFKTKFSNTCIKKFGKPTNLMCEDTKNKIVQTNRKKRKCDNVMQDPSVRNILSNTMINLYNVDNAMKVKEFQIKTENTNIKKRGVRNVMQDIKVQKKHKQTCNDHFGENNWAQTEKGKLFHRENIWKRIEKQYSVGEPVTPCISSKGRECLNDLEKIFKCKILREIRILGYSVDGMIEKTTKIIEFDSRHNFKDFYITLTEHDEQRQKRLEALGYTFFRIKLLDWKNNKEKVIKEFKYFINEMEQQSCIK